MTRSWLIFDDARGYYFIRLGLGIFWECGSKAEDAKRFTSRNQAVKVMQSARKHLEGWRVIEERTA